RGRIALARMLAVGGGGVKGRRVALHKPRAEAEGDAPGFGAAARGVAFRRKPRLNIARAPATMSRPDAGSGTETGTGALAPNVASNVELNDAGPGASANSAAASSITSAEGITGTATETLP